LNLKYLLPRIPFNHEHFVDIIYLDGDHILSFSPTLPLVLLVFMSQGADSSVVVNTGFLTFTKI